MKVLLLFCFFALGGMSFGEEMRLVTELLNRVIQQQVFFEYNFRSKKPIECDRAHVFIYEPIQMLSYKLSTVGDNDCTFRLQLPAGFRVEPENNHETVLFDYCYVEVECIIDQTLVKPLSVTVSSCRNIRLKDGTPVEEPNRYLKQLSAALLSQAQDVIDIETSKDLLTLPAIYQIFSFIVHRDFRSLNPTNMTTL